MRFVAAAAVAIVLGIGATACSTEQLAGTPSTTGSVELPAPVPATFAESAQWATDVSPDVPPIVTDDGIVVIAPRDDDDPADSYRVAMLDLMTGTPIWRSVPILSSTTPTVSFTSSNGRPWVVVAASTEDPAESLVVTFDGLGSGERLEPAAELTLRGEDDRPSVIVSDSGILVRGATEPGPAFRLHPDSGATSQYGTGPRRDGVEATPRRVRGHGFLVSYAGGGFAFASPSGGWESTENVPSSDVSPNSGTFKTTTGHVLLAEWVNPDGSTLALHDIPTGAVLATHQVRGDVSHDTPTHLILSDDGRWAVWGEYVFNLVDGTGDVLSVDDEASPVSVHQDLLYLRPAPDLGNDTSLPSPSDTPTEPTSTSDDVELIDLTIGRTTVEEVDAVPVGFTSFGDGVFHEDGVVYAVSPR